MYEGVDKLHWNQTSHIMSVIMNSRMTFEKNPRVFLPDELNPYKNVQPTKPLGQDIKAKDIGLFHDAFFDRERKTYPGKRLKESIK